MYHKLIECYNNLGKMIFTYSNPVLTVYDIIDFSEPGGIVRDIDNNHIQILIGNIDITINMDKLQYDAIDGIYTYHDSGTDVTISFI